MDATKAEQAMREMTMVLIYLSRFTESGRFSTGSKDFFAWKGYDFDVLNKLNDDDFIRQGTHPSRSKSVYITDTGATYAKSLMEKYAIIEWE